MMSVRHRVSDAVGVADQGQISKLLLMRLEGHGLLENTGGQTQGTSPNAWQLTPRGEEICGLSCKPGHRPLRP